MACRFEWQPAKRAGRSPGPDHLDRPARERARGLGADPHPQHRGAVLGDILGEGLKRFLALFLGLNDDALVVVIPGEGDRADPEVLCQREVEGAVVDARVRW